MIANSRHRAGYVGLGKEDDLVGGEPGAVEVVQVLQQLGLRTHAGVAYTGDKVLASVENPEQVDQVGF